MRGRKPVPTALKLLRGNPGKRQLNRQEPRPPTLSTDCPDELEDAEMRAEWRRTIAPAIAIGQIGGGDRALAIAHCEVWAAWRALLIEAAKHPPIMAIGPQKYPMPNLARTTGNKTLHLLVKIDAELGLTPVARSRVKVGGPTSEDAEHAELRRLLTIR